ncbi:MAG: ATP-binding cassette domain-containing protein [Planctomycetes bacterium]|nr:ATP-binding cassette domain-containing protein [Planctomycetota bacterium]
MASSKEYHIEVESLDKGFLVPEKKDRITLKQKVSGLLYRKWEKFEVLKNLSFQIEKGEFVGYIGANGAGKSTTIKLLTGILNPDSGNVKCAGFSPYNNRYQYTYHIGVVFGQKSILEYEVPVQASFDLYREIYEMDRTTFDKRIDFFHEILSLRDYLHIPVRKLSFGQRMRCEVAASLLHQPEIVFLDEPTIGLDAKAKKEIRSFLQAVNEQEKTTILLTTHDMKDIESLCNRVLMIDKGSLIYDGELGQLKKQFLREKTIRFSIDTILDQNTFNQLKENTLRSTKEGDDECWTIGTDQCDIADFARELLHAARFLDFTITEPELEEVVGHIYAEGFSSISENE